MHTHTQKNISNYRKKMRKENYTPNYDNQQCTVAGSIKKPCYDHTRMFSELIVQQGQEIYKNDTVMKIVNKLKYKQNKRRTEQRQKREKQK